MTMTNAEWMINNGLKFKNLKTMPFLEHNACLVISYRSADGKYTDLFAGKQLGDTSYESILTWLDMEHKYPILDDAERRYLSAFIKPFKDKVKYIQKFEGHWSARHFEQISIRYYDEITRYYVYFELPRFDKGTMYKGMEVNRHYTLEELGL